MIVPSVFSAGWIKKIVQLFETNLVRHGIMLCGPAGAGKTQVCRTLAAALSKTTGTPHKEMRINPKAIRAPELYGEVDSLTGEWTTGVFAAIWAKYNKRSNKFITWIIEDGPVDAIWIEDLNTVLDDNRILTLANGDRIPMTDNTKIMFENENLDNASPATVSRAGIIWVSDTDLDWGPIAQGWVLMRPLEEQELLNGFFLKWLGENNPQEPGIAFNFISRSCDECMPSARMAKVMSMFNLLTGMLDDKGYALSSDPEKFGVELERMFVFCIVWTVGGVLETADRIKFDEFLRTIDSDVLPQCSPGLTIYEYRVNTSSLEWERWTPPEWHYPDLASDQKLDFSNLLVPTMDTTRSLYLIETMTKQKLDVLMIGGPGTAKTSTGLLYFTSLDPNTMTSKLVNFSSATTPGMFQANIESGLDKRGGKSFGPPNGMSSTIFMDDLSMPLVNDWGDQPTLEIVRQIVENDAIAFLDKDKRGDIKQCEDLQYIAAMSQPGGGKNFIPKRLLRHFLAFNLVLPSITSINDMYGQMLDGRFTKDIFDSDTLDVVGALTEATIKMWNLCKSKMLPTPAKFHYVFNIRELSRVFQGVLLCPDQSILTGGMATPSKDAAVNILSLWKHEVDRVFCDKLVDTDDKAWFRKSFESLVLDQFGDVLGQQVTSNELCYVDFLRDDVFDEDEVLIAAAPKIYEPGGTLPMIRDRVQSFLDKYNVEFPNRQMPLVLFDDALRHMIRIARILGMPRGSVLLVGVGGSGKQSLARLASYIARNFTFQITLTKAYNTASLMEDLRVMYREAGQKQQSTTFIFNETEIKDENFLEYINSLLMTGTIPGLFAKDEMMGLTADLQDKFADERPGLIPSMDNLNQFFIDIVRDNLHVVLSMSPKSAKFPERARFFPGLINCCTVDWFLPWSEEALVTVSRGFIGDFEIDCDPDEKIQLMDHMGNVHNMVQLMCTEYFAKMRRNVYQTPKSYLSFIQNYKSMYSQKLEEVNQKERNIRTGLSKLIQGAEDVEAMKLVLADEQVKLAVATDDTNKMLGSLEISSLEAKKENDLVEGIKASCEEDAARIAQEKELCQSDLDKAMPFVTQAENAIKSIKPADIQEIKKLPKPSPIIKLIFDGVCCLFHEPLIAVKAAEMTINKQDIIFIDPSFGSAMKLMADMKFLDRLVEFGRVGKDLMNPETVEFLAAYMSLDSFNPVVAKNASSASAGLCLFVTSMKSYYEASKVVKPKLEALDLAMNQLAVANKKLAEAMVRLGKVQAKLNELQVAFETQMAAKTKIEDGARALEQKMQQASDLINGLAGERVRWTEDANNFSDVKRRLVGDCAVVCAFTSYTGPFNQEYRDILIKEKFVADCLARGVPVTKQVDVVSFQVDIGTIGDWNLQGLPTDILSTQNGIMVTKSSRYPLMIDPQGQAVKWLTTREAERMPMTGVCQINNPRLKDTLEFCMGEGRAFIVAGVEQEIDPMLDPVLNKEITTRGRSKYIVVSDKQCEYMDSFMMYFITRLPNPHFSPELQAKTTVVDFTVTMKGLEDQLLGRVIGKEQQALEMQLAEVLAEVNQNTKSLLHLDALLLERLSSNTGNLLDDVELVGVLAETKAKAADVKLKLAAADETRENINVKREQFRPVATRGSVLYFSIVDMTHVSVMYQTSLAQFLQLFMASMDHAEKANVASKRVANIIDTMTYEVYRYINRGLYEPHKIVFVFILTFKILVTTGMLSQQEFGLYLRAGAALNIASVKAKPFAWLPNDVWLNVVQLCESVPFFASLPEEMGRNEAIWRRWFDSNMPEIEAIPDYEMRIAENTDTGPWLRLLVIRMLRMDRTKLATRAFIRGTKQTGPRYVEAVTDTIESVFNSMVPEVPVIFLLSVGADPTEAIEQLCRKKKQTVAVVSMGEGQEGPALKALNAASVNGSWVLLQNCELGLDLMVQLEELLLKMRPSLSDGFRFFITAGEHPQFPLALLQMSDKVTNEPPAGLQAGLVRSYTVTVTQESMERIETPLWRKLLFNLCFLHSIVFERRKYGPLGFCIPYEFNTNDLSACIMFLEKHLYAGVISWPTVQYMVSEVQYGGKITDDFDRRLFNSYAAAWITPASMEPEFSYNPAHSLVPIPNDFVYNVQDHMEVDKYKSYCMQFPEADSPEVFGLHPNADITFLIKDVTELLGTLGETAPKSSGAGGGRSREEIVYDQAGDLLETSPDNYIPDDYNAKIRKLGGLDVPLNIFLFQEIERLQKVIGKLKFDLGNLRQAVRGEVVLTSELQQTINSMYVCVAKIVGGIGVVWMLVWMLVFVWCSPLVAQVAN